ncbi:protein indeterminate-domain 7 isoform X1 [Daucus carota subsp. sativus]|uniref:protein indeterminate-domain 7 isoform X1 n=2 Tax=Daucus carota subsp. sativus TaxID=79200 RepID=UPI0007F027F6|nr:PREDICTED: protein indeterminate-domain 7-like isoform X1 [Daucus carota subsp. sativus]
MSNISSASGNQTSASSGVNLIAHEINQPPLKRKRNLPGNPDPDAEVIALSPTTLMARNRFVCEICNKGFQRDQNLQLHRRGHNLPWKLKQRNSKEAVRKKVYVCPETSCVHHEASRALGDLTGIKKHFSRKHGEKKWKCERCNKRYAVQSDWKAHSKTCGTKEYRCDCGTIFSRRDSFITHRAFCDALAEETTKSIPALAASANANPVHQPAAPTSTTSTSDNVNNNSSLPPQLFNNLTHHFNAFSMKKEQQQQQIPQWLAPLGLAPHAQTPMTTYNHQQQFTDHHQISPYHQHLTQPITSPDNPNPNPSSTGPGPTRASPYIMKSVTADMTSPHMSATALLQKAALMGATMSTQTSTSSLPSMSMIGLMKPHQPQAEEASRVLSSFNNKDAYNSCLTMEQESHAAATAAAPSHQDRHLVFDQGSRVTPFQEFAFKTAGNDDGMTRDFLGLRPLSNSEILDIANLQPNYMNPNNTSKSADHTVI